LLVLLPASDYKAFLGNMTDVKTEGEVSEGKLRGQNDTAYVAQWGEYVAMSPTRAVVATKPAKALAAQGVTAKEVAEKDIVVYANFAQIREKALPELQKNRANILAKVEEGIAGAQKRQQAAAAGGENGAAPAANAPNAQALKAMVNQGLNLAQQFLQDTQAVTWGVNLSDDGIKSSLVAEFAGDSYLGQMASASKNTDQSLLTGLPAGNYLFLMGMKVDPQQAGKLIDDLSTPVIKELKAAGVDTAAIEKYAASTKQFYGSTDRMGMGVVAPTGALGQDALFQSVAVVEGDADQITASIRGMSESQAGLTKLMGQPDDQTKVAITANAKTVGGVAFDQVQTTFNFGADNPQAAQAQQMIAILYGPEGMNMLSGKTDEKHVVVTTGANDELIAKTVTAAKGNEDALAKLEQIKAVDAQLPGNRLMVMYVPLDNLISTGVSYARQFGMPVNVQLPPNLPPIGGSLSTEGSAYRMDGYLPAQLVQSLVSAGMQAFMAMQGGGAQPGGPGGL
jgi:hypothetical protein